MPDLTKVAVDASHHRFATMAHFAGHREDTHRRSRVGTGFQPPLSTAGRYVRAASSSNEASWISSDLASPRRGDGFSSKSPTGSYPDGTTCSARARLYRFD